MSPNWDQIKENTIEELQALGLQGLAEVLFGEAGKRETSSLVRPNDLSIKRWKQYELEIQQNRNTFDALPSHMRN